MLDSAGQVNDASYVIGCHLSQVDDEACMMDLCLPCTSTQGLLGLEVRRGLEARKGLKARKSPQSVASPSFSPARGCLPTVCLACLSAADGVERAVAGRGRRQAQGSLRPSTRTEIGA
jgi:hypothetical protein